MKYQIGDLKAKIVSIIERDWPTTLKEWDVFSKRMEDLRSTPHLILADYMPEPASAIRLALKCKELRKILPAAYHHLCRIHPKDVFDARRRMYDDRRRKIYARWCLLPPESIVLCLTARMQFNEKSNTFREIFMDRIRRLALQHTPHDKQNTDACRLGLLRMCDSFFSDYALRHDLLSSTLRFTQSSEILKVNWSICNDCASEVRRLFERRRAELWNELPQIFSLGKLHVFKYCFCIISDQTSGISG